MLGNRAFLGAVDLRPYRPVHAGKHVGQSGPFVEVRPNINIESPKIAPVINVELGGLPLSIGLFAGSALTFYLKSHLPEGWPRTTALVTGAALAALGITNLMVPKARASEAQKTSPAAPPGPAPMPAPSAPGGAAAASSPQAYSASNAMAFENVTGRIVHPAEYSTIGVGWFKKSYPVRVQLMNSSSVPVTFELELTADEDPAPVGDPVVSSLPVQVSIDAGQVKDVDVEMPIADWGNLVDYSDVILTARKRRVPGEPAQMIDMRSFVLE
jgi:hypothetical protein